MPKYVDVYRLFKRGEQMAVCKEALAGGPKSTRELALAVMETKAGEPPGSFTSFECSLRAERSSEMEKEEPR